MADQVFGEIPGIEEGAKFKDRIALKEAGVHRTLVSGIDGNPKEGASSIVLNGGYVDDYDLGTEIIYTGHGGNRDGRQVADQSWDAPGNKGLIVSELLGLPVRVTRGSKHRSSFSPKNDYVYGGLYQVIDHFSETGKHGFSICRYRLKKLNNTDEVAVSEEDTYLPEGSKNTIRVKTTTLRVVRDTSLSKAVKRMYGYKCQICDTRIEVRNVPYAEAAHIRPLGRPHNGNDAPENILCLCPNHHVMFDIGCFTISTTGALIGIEGELKVHKKHKIDKDNLSYHKRHIFINY
ncbi:YDG/SRA domain-containing protein [Pseudocnuella soli]|uniref:YDG/SRA domain-containing protein n=1 Tax=Pseudocnuella soli TaxID=2502779 RepID=UPI001046B717|nr:YDG/SRA domain-containing protein [Pseudocnuella soli]